MYVKVRNALGTKHVDMVHICMVLYANNDKELFYKAESTKGVNQQYQSTKTLDESKSQVKVVQQ